MTSSFVHHHCHQLKPKPLRQRSHYAQKQASNCSSQAGGPIYQDYIFLGIEIDSHSQELRLPPEKLARIMVMLRQREGCRSATKLQLQSLIGLLNHAAAVVRPGCTFIRQLIDTMKIPRRQFHRVHLNQQCKADLVWWSTFIQTWNGISLFPDLHPGPKMVPDASGSWGCGLFLPASHNWFLIPWPLCLQKINITTKELFLVVMAAAIGGKHWTGLSIQFQSDNQAVVRPGAL